MAKRPKHYPIASEDWRHVPYAIRQALSSPQKAMSSIYEHIHEPQGEGQFLAAVYAGEKRAPRAGEWFLSGASVAAYFAPNDLTMVYHIARIVRVTKALVVTHTIENLQPQYERLGTVCSRHSRFPSRSLALARGADHDAADSAVSP